MRALLVLGAAFALAPAGWASSGTSLTITVWPQGKAGPSSTWTLGCNPPAGTLPSPAAGCSALARHPGALKPVPGRQACTMIYGGPQVAFVVGTFWGHRIRSRFNRANGCEIGRWDKLKALFPAAG
jgi:hypothetical protein